MKPKCFKLQSNDILRHLRSIIIETLIFECDEDNQLSAASQSHFLTPILGDRRLAHAEHLRIHVTFGRGAPFATWCQPQTLWSVCFALEKASYETAEIVEAQQAWDGALEKFGNASVAHDPIDRFEVKVKMLPHVEGSNVRQLGLRQPYSTLSACPAIFPRAKQGLIEIDRKPPSW